MIRMEDAPAEKKLSTQTLLQVHDELIFEVPDEEMVVALSVVQHVMQDAPLLAVASSAPLQVDARATNNWDEAH
jgi:DNA polymerase I